MEDYDRALSEVAGSGEEPEGVVEGEPAGEVEEVTPPVENPIDTIHSIQQMGILELVFSDFLAVSQKAVDVSAVVSNRTLQKGMRIFEGQETEETAAENLLFQEYILRQVENFQRPA